MKDVQNKLLQKALDLLGHLPVEYVIRDDEGHLHQAGNLKVHINPSGITRNRTGRNYTALYVPILEHLPPGECAVIPIPADLEEPERLRSTITAWCTNHWGKKSYMSSVTSDKRSIEVLRFKPGPVPFERIKGKSVPDQPSLV